MLAHDFGEVLLVWLVMVDYFTTF